MENGMLNVSLQTKLYVPRSKPRLVSRPRLLSKLDQITERKLTLVSAPAGFGKSTLLSEWIEHQRKGETPVQIAWLSLDSSDDDPARFLTYLVAALQNVNINVEAEIIPLLSAFKISSIKEIWEILAGQIASDPSPFVIILDDYHVIQNPTIHEGIMFMLNQMPPMMHLVISSRVDPPFPLSRLRVCGELVELRVADLRFSSEEVTDFLDQWIGKKLSSTDQAELEARTEGWIAGLQLAALAMHSLLEETIGDENSLSAFVHRLSGNTRLIMDYLVEEVLHHLSEDWHSFLLQTSILEQLTAGLCDALTDRNDSQVILEALEKTNLFLFALDDERGWYRYHHLFADLLRNFLQVEQPARIPELHYRASVWYEAQGLMTEAIQHALKGPDPDEAARLMEKVGLETLLRGEVNTIQHWSACIADEQAQQRPFLCIYFALSFIVSDKLEQAEHYLSLIDVSSSVLDLQGPTMAAYSLLAACKSDDENTIRYAKQALEQLPTEQTYLRGVVAYSLGAAYRMIGEDERAEQSLQEARQLGHASGNRLAEISALNKLGDLSRRRGQLHRAALSYQQALQLGSLPGGRLLPFANQTVSALGKLHYEWDRIEEAENLLHQSVELSRKLENPYDLLSNVQTLALVHWTQGERESALRLRREAEQIMLEYPPIPVVAARVALQQVRMYLKMGDVQAAARTAQLYEQDRKLSQAESIELMAILSTRVFLAQEKASEAIQTLKPALRMARAAGRQGVVIELLVLQALARAQAHEIPLALAALTEALGLAESEAYTRIFVDEGEPMARLLRMVYRSKEKGAREYETRLLERLLPGESPAPSVSSTVAGSRSVDHPVLIDPLTERELEVLRMIAEGHSNQEIAEKLVITLGTVKAHVSTIYRKLDVRSRSQAILKADQLRLLKP